jgi:hypothetical protein
VRTGSQREATLGVSQFRFVMTLRLIANDVNNNSCQGREDWNRSKRLNQFAVWQKRGDDNACYYYDAECDCVAAWLRVMVRGCDT